MPPTAQEMIRHSSSEKSNSSQDGLKREVEIEPAGLRFTLTKQPYYSLVKESQTDLLKETIVMYIDVSGYRNLYSHILAKVFKYYK